MPHDTEANKRNAIDFYRTACLGDPEAAVATLRGRRLHPARVGDGKQPFIDYFTGMARDYADKSIEFVRAVAEGDLVALHTHQVWPGDEHVRDHGFLPFRRRRQDRRALGRDPAGAGRDEER